MSSSAAALVELSENDEVDALIDAAIRRFVAGETAGTELFQALYGEVLDEPVPAHLLAVVRGA